MNKETEDKVSKTLHEMIDNAIEKALNDTDNIIYESVDKAISDEYKKKWFYYT